MKNQKVNTILESMMKEGNSIQEVVLPEVEEVAQVAQVDSMVVEEAVLLVAEEVVLPVDIKTKG